MPSVRYIPVHLDQQQRRPIAGLDIDEDDSRVWHLTWFRQPANIKVFRAAMRRAETAVLPHGGEFIRFQSPENCPEVTAELHDWNATEPISDARQRWELTLMLAGEDGLVHEDDDDRTPLHRITCPTCVWRIAEGRIRRRERAGPEGPRGMAQHSQRIADAYARLAEVERALVLRPISKDPDPRYPEPRYPEPGPELRERFNEHANQWERETHFLSNMHTAAQHPAYRAIVAMGNDAVRPLIERLDAKGGHWTMALQEITGADDLIPEAERGQVNQMRLRWLDWGWQHGLLPPA